MKNLLLFVAALSLCLVVSQESIAQGFSYRGPNVQLNVGRGLYNPPRPYYGSGPVFIPRNDYRYQNHWNDTYLYSHPRYHVHQNLGYPVYRSYPLYHEPVYRGR